MRRKSVLLGSALLVVLGGAVAAVVALLVLHEPASYHQAALPPGQERQQHSHEFVSKCSELYVGVMNDREWRQKFTAAQINSYLDEDFVRSGQDKMLPEGISDPRVSFAPGKVRLAFRYGAHTWC